MKPMEDTTLCCWPGSSTQGPVILENSHDVVKSRLILATFFGEVVWGVLPPKFGWVFVSSQLKNIASCNPQVFEGDIPYTPQKNLNETGSMGWTQLILTCLLRVRTRQTLLLISPWTQDLWGFWWKVWKLTWKNWKTTIAIVKKNEKKHVQLGIFASRDQSVAKKFNEYFTWNSRRC